MSEDTARGGEPPRPSALEVRLRAAPEAPVPVDLLGRCLATIPGGGRGAPPVTRRPARFAFAAAALLAAAVAFLARPGPADAARLLKSVHTAWTKVPASHQVVRRRGPGGPRTEETWFVRGKGRRTEVRAGDELIGLTVNNRRWEFRRDVRGRTVAAWSTDLDAPHQAPGLAGLVLGSEALIRWAEAHRAEIRVERDRVAGRDARKVVLRGPGASGRSAPPEAVTVWFDPDSLRPVRSREEYADGRVTEASVDDPDPGAVPADLLTFRMPRDVVLEINDPDLGRQVYSESQARGAAPDARTPKGAER